MLAPWSSCSSLVSWPPEKQPLIFFFTLVARVRGMDTSASIAQGIKNTHTTDQKVQYILVHVEQKEKKNRRATSISSRPHEAPRQIPSNDNESLATATKRKQHPVGALGRDTCSFCRGTTRSSPDGYIFCHCMHCYARHCRLYSRHLPRHAATASRKNLGRHARKPLCKNATVRLKLRRQCWGGITHLLGCIRHENRARLGAGAHFPARSLGSKPDTHTHTCTRAEGGGGVAH